MRDTSLTKGQLSSCRTSSTMRCSQADSSWTPWFLPEDLLLPEEEAGPEGSTGRVALEGAGPEGLESWLCLPLGGWA